MDQARFAEQWDAGSKQPLEEMIDFALEKPGPKGSPL
jgi:hypothetical protein